MSVVDAHTSQQQHSADGPLSACARVTCILCLLSACFFWRSAGEEDALALSRHRGLRGGVQGALGAWGRSECAGSGDEGLGGMGEHGCRVLYYIGYYDNISLFSSKTLELIVIVKRGNSSLLSSKNLAITLLLLSPEIDLVLALLLVIVLGLYHAYDYANTSLALLFLLPFLIRLRFRFL